MSSPKELAFQVISDEGKVQEIPELANHPLMQDREVRHKLEMIMEPEIGFRAEELIRLTLQIQGKVGPVEARRAVVVAWLTPLRQHVGSCFATAPAIRIQKEQPLRFLDDMDALIATGRLTRVVEGVEYAVPLSPNWGEGDCPLLKAWEFTLASFAEAKTNFSKWNLYTSLGLTPDEPDGLGEVLRNLLQERLDAANREAEELHHRYEGAYYQATHIEGRLRRASEEEARWLRMEYRRRVDEMQMIEQQRNFAQSRASLLAGSLPFLIEQYTKLFPAYFQEIYDAEMVRETAHLYDDRPAGFRLLYKHGRSNPSQWTLIYNREEFVDALVAFFLATERLLAQEPQMEGLERDLSDLVGSMIQHIRLDRFYEGALARMKRLHEKEEALPWAYISGGGMKELVSCYYQREQITLRKRNVESAEDLFVFLLDTMKELPANESDRYLENPWAGMLMQSPTHGFQYLPGLLQEGWLDRGNTGSWIRDRVIHPQEDLIAGIRLTPQMVRWLYDQIGLEKKPPAQRIRLPNLRDLLVREGLLAEQIDSIFYHLFPLTLPGEAHTIVQELTGSPPEQRKTTFVSAIELLRMCGPTAAPTLRQMGKLLPAPVIFADTNWSVPYFGFLVNPGTLRLEVWRTDGLAETAPMGSWFSDSIGKEWAVYSRPSELT